MQAFDDIDIDKSGHINRKELRAALQLIGQNPTNADMLKYMPDGKSIHFKEETLQKNNGDFSFYGFSLKTGSEG